MAREGRQKSSNGIYHVLLRGVDKLFLTDSDYAEFRARLSEYFGEKSHLLAYLLLPNRVHLLVDEGSVDLVYAIKPLCTSYARYYNKTYSLDGKLFYDRFKSVPAETEDEISDTVAFFNAIGNAVADKKNFSLYEYTGKAELCSTENLIDLIGKENAVSKKPVSLHLDDYSQLKESDMELYLKLCIGKTLKEVGDMDRKSEAFTMLFAGRGISSRSVLPLFGILAKSHPAPVAEKAPVKVKAADKKKTASAPKPKPKAEPKKKEEAVKEKTAEASVPAENISPPQPKPQKKNLSVWLL